VRRYRHPPVDALLDGRRRADHGGEDRGEDDRGRAPGYAAADRNDHADDREESGGDPRHGDRHPAGRPDPQLVDADGRQGLSPDHGDGEQGDTGDRHRIRLGEDEEPADDAADALPPADLVAAQGLPQRTEPLSHTRREGQDESQRRQPRPEAPDRSVQAVAQPGRQLTVHPGLPRERGAGEEGDDDPERHVSGRSAEYR
jgi:hypothetical protein